MKVMISTDMEGVSGIVDFDQIMSSTANFERARAYFTHDVNAAVEGALAGGATEVVVTDSHALQLNVIYEDLHPEAQLVMGGHKSHRGGLVMETLDSSYDLVLLVGYHAAAHYPGGIISHSYHLPAAFWEVRINDMPVGETEIGAALAGARGIPVGLLTGDNYTVEEGLKVLPGIETVITKWAVDRTAARCLSLAKTGELIRAAAQRAVERGQRGEFQPWTFDPPLTLQITCGHAGVANKLGGVPNAVKVAPRVVKLEADSYEEIYEGLLTFVYLALTSNDPAFD